MPQITKPVDRFFPYPDDPLKGEILIHHLTPGEVKKITLKSFTQNISYHPVAGKKLKDLNPTITQNTDTNLNIELTLIASIKDWKNFFEEDGKTPMEFSKENILSCSAKIDGFDDAVDAMRNKLAADIAKEKEDQLKNLKGSARK